MKKAQRTLPAAIILFLAMAVSGCHGANSSSQLSTSSSASSSPSASSSSLSSSSTSSSSTSSSPSSSSSEIIYRMISFESNGGTAVEIQQIIDGGLVSRPTDPTRIEYTFDDWYTTNAFGLKWNFETNTVHQDMTLYAKWLINQYSIFYHEIETYFVMMAVGYAHSMAITSTGQVYAWGLNNYGQLGDDTTTSNSAPTAITARFGLAAGDKVVSLAGGECHSLALTSTGRVYAWGYNYYGQLGDDTTVDKYVPTEITSRFSLATGDKVVSLAAGECHSMAITSTGRVFIWGANYYSQLGDGTMIQQNVPMEITLRFNLESGDKVISLAAGYGRSMVVTSTGRVFTWGYNFAGELGDNSTANKHIPMETTSLFSLASGDKVVSLSAGYHHSMAVTSTGRVFTWGANYYGQLGDTTTTQRNVPTEITSQLSLAAGDKVVSLGAGGYHSMALTSTGRVFTWGNNFSGQIGDDTIGQKSSETEITSRLSLATGDKVVSIAAGYECSMAVTSTGRGYVWGNYLFGNGTVINETVPTEITYSMIFISLINTVVYENGATTTEYIPVREEYTFSGWFTDVALNNAYTFTTMPANDVMLYGHFYPNA